MATRTLRPSSSRAPSLNWPQLGLCCKFVEQPIRFRTTTATALQRLPRGAQRHRLAELCLANAEALRSALEYCVENHFGCFRVGSDILPLKTHPSVGYALEDLPDGPEIVARYRHCGQFARRHNLRTVLHPDQFVVLNSPRSCVVESSLAELDAQAELAEWIAADVINVHAGGVYGDKEAALDALCRGIDRLPRRVRKRLTLENDDRCYTPADLLPICRREGIPFVYDVHHHRCLPDGRSIEEVTEEALVTWNRQPLLHVSSPLGGWKSNDPRRHADYIRATDFPREWDGLEATVEVEAKAKELAVVKLTTALARRQRTRRAKTKPA